MISRKSVKRRISEGKRILTARGRKQLEELTPREIGMAGTTRKPCSCCSCGNPRKWFGEKTLQERRAFQEEE